MKPSCPRLIATLVASVAAAYATTPAAASPRVASTIVDGIFAAWDADRDGRLTSEEFHRGWTALQRRREVEAGLKAQFARLDADHSGAIDAREYGSITLAREAGAGAPMSRFDANRDQRLDFNEYLRLVRVLAPAVVPSSR